MAAKLLNFVGRCWPYYGDHRAYYERIVDCGKKGVTLIRSTVALLGIVCIPAFTQQAQGPLTDQRIVDLALAGVSQSEIIRIISSAPEVTFVLSPLQEQAMMNAGVTEDIIKAMAAREEYGPGAGQPSTEQSESSAQTYMATPAAAPRTNTGPQLSATVAKSKKGSKAQIVVTAVSYSAIPHENDMTFTLPGHVSTKCYGTGSSSSYTSVSCSSYVMPPTDVPLNIKWIEVYNNVTGDDGMAYTIKCTAHWVGSACSWLRPGEQFAAEVDGNTMHLAGRRGGNRGRAVHPKF